MKRRTFVSQAAIATQAAGAAVAWSLAAPALAGSDSSGSVDKGSGNSGSGNSGSGKSGSDNSGKVKTVASKPTVSPLVMPGNDAVLQWNAVLTASLAATATDPTVSSRAISMVYEAVYNAWAAYHPYASFTLAGLGRKPVAEFTLGNKVLAISQAARDVLVDLFPTQRPRIDAALLRITAGQPLGPVAAAAVLAGKTTAAALLKFRHADGSNQLGDLVPGAYADYTGYKPVNTPDLLVDPTRWQPLRIVNLQNQLVVQKFLSPHWGKVKSFALPSGSALRPDLGAPAPTAAELAEMVDLSAALTDTTKAIVDYWAANPGSVTPAGMWTQTAQIVSARDGNTLDDDVKMYFALGQAVLDAGIACWDAKRAFDSVRPITAVRYYLRGRTIRSWGGPGLGAVTMKGENWKPYQRAIRPSPNFPEFPSGHSTFSAASAAVLAGLRGSDKIDLSFVFPARAVPFDPTVPARDVVQTFSTLSAAADAAGFSRRLGGIHFQRGDLAGRAIGRQVGALVLARCQQLFEGQARYSRS